MASSSVSKSAAVDDALDGGWVYWPAAENPKRTAVVLLAIMLAGAVAGWQIGSLLCGLLAAGLLLVTLANFLLPIRYRLTLDGLVVRGIGAPTLIKWSRIDAARLRDDHALLLVTPDGHSTPREFRLRFDRQGAAIDALRQRLLDAGAPLM